MGFGSIRWRLIVVRMREAIGRETALQEEGPLRVVVILSACHAEDTGSIPVGTARTLGGRDSWAKKNL